MASAPETNVKLEEATAEAPQVEAPQVETQEENGQAELKQEKTHNEPKQKNDNDSAKQGDLNGAKAEEERTANEKITSQRDTNIISDPSLLPESNDPAEIRKQVEFYFSDSNLPFDKFLFSMVGFENKWVPLKLVASFKRMRRFADFTAIQNALSESDFLELNQQKNQVRRKVPLMKPEQRKIQQVVDKTLSRSIYAKGFGDETPTSQFDIEKFFEPYGHLNAVRLRRTPEKVFKGSVFVEFKDEESMRKFMALEEKPKYNGTELTYMSKKDYVDMKIKDIEEGKIEPSSREKHNKFNAFKEAAKNRHKRKGNEGDRDGADDDKEEGKRDKRKQQRGRVGKGNRRGGRGSRNSHGGRGGIRNGGKDARKTDDGTVPTVKATANTAPQGTKRPRDDTDNEPPAEKKVKIEDVEEQAASTEKKIKTEDVEEQAASTEKKIKTEDVEEQVASTN